MRSSLRNISFFAIALSFALASSLLLAAYWRGRQRLALTPNQVPTETVSTVLADALYLNPELGLIIRYPSTWIAEEGPLAAGNIPMRFRGADGFLELAVTGEPGATLSLAVNDIAFSEEQPYGANPRVTVIMVGGQEGRLITPVDSQISDAAILVPFPQPVMLSGQSAAFLVLHADRVHLEAIATRLRFVRNRSGEITGLPNILVYKPRSNDIVDGAISVSGVARVFESSVSLRLIDSYTNQIFLEQATMTAAPDVGTYGTFAVDLNLPRIENLRSITLEVYQASARDGTPMDVVRIPLRLAP